MFWRDLRELSTVSGNYVLFRLFENYYYKPQCVATLRTNVNGNRGLKPLSQETRSTF